MLGCGKCIHKEKFLRPIKIVCSPPPVAAIAMLATVVACVQAPAVPTVAPKAAVAPVHPAAPPDVDSETASLQASLPREVPNLTVDTPDASRAWIARAQSAIATSDFKIDRPQLVVVVDRNPDTQQMRILLARSEGRWIDLGGTKVSTGQTGRRDYYITPTGPPIFSLFTSPRPRGQRHAYMGFRLANSEERLGSGRNRRHPPTAARDRPGLSRAPHRSSRIKRVRAYSCGDELIPRPTRGPRRRL